MAAVSPDQLASIADAMNAMRCCADATIGYDLLSDALVWSDEIPDLGERRPREFWCLRPVLRSRTTVILGVPDVEFEEYWTEARRRFPSWPGFQPSRCREDASLAETYERLRTDGMASVDECGSVASAAGTRKQT